MLFVRCEYCQGTGKQLCPTCGGASKSQNGAAFGSVSTESCALDSSRVAYNSRKDDSADNSGKGESLRCEVCKGKGVIKCPGCCGSGYVDMPAWA